ncbi:metal transporter CNNM4 [Galendromus occidentalis]|uniref:Metal transporter CNNM4 n=1 Tax=Galendromus occidentalis TaxID=34638 RepID=A0AAJ7SGI5_9ACAR|nr:metal transporter CNNM4 [Galendromus occidentalis]
MHQKFSHNGTVFQQNLRVQGVLPPQFRSGEPIEEGMWLYLCIQRGLNESFRHLGEEIKFKYLSSESRQLAPEISGFRFFGSTRISVDTETGTSEIPADTSLILQVFGSGFNNTTALAFTNVPAAKGASCDNMALAKVILFSTDAVLVQRDTATIRAEFAASPGLLYLCVKYMNEEGEKNGWTHQGDPVWLSFRCAGRLLPIWVQASLIGVLLVLSGLFSGLNLGLMALDKTELRVIESCGTPSEQKCAKAIAPLRNHGNYLLCSLLLGNVLVNNTLTILMDDLTSGLVAILSATIAIVIFGEIIPQAICSRHGLEVGARTLVITKIFMVITFPASYPISLVLDYCLGEEIGHVYDREKLVEYIKLTMDYTQLANEEVNIISGALELKTKHAGQIMTIIDDVFMLPYDTVLDFETVSNIIRQGYTRIPVYDGNRDTIVALLNIKDLAFVDPADAFPLKTVCDFYKHPLTYCFEDQCLDELLDEFKKGKSHMSIVQSIRTADDADPIYTVVGIVTLEDVIEEILKIEIVDETDVLTDNRERKKRKEVQLSKQDFTDFAKTNVTSLIPAPLALATFQFMSTALEPFRREYVSENVLRRLMVQNIFIHIKQEDLRDDTRKFIYRAGKATDYFVLLLEGRARVTHHTSANETLQYEAGSFSYFGVPSIFVVPAVTATATEAVQTSQLSLASPMSDYAHLPDRPFCPDYSVEAISDMLYMRVHRNVYAAAYKASRLDKSNRSNATTLETEWANVINAVNSSNHRPAEVSARGSLATTTVPASGAGTPCLSPGSNAAQAPLARNSDSSICSIPLQEYSPHGAQIRSPELSRSVALELASPPQATASNNKSSRPPSGSQHGGSSSASSTTPKDREREVNERTLLLSGNHSTSFSTSATGESGKS